MRKWVALFLAIVFAISMGLSTVYAATPAEPEEDVGFGGCFICCSYGCCAAVGYGCVCKCVSGQPICTCHGAQSY